MVPYDTCIFATTANMHTHGMPTPSARSSRSSGELRGCFSCPIFSSCCYPTADPMLRQDRSASTAAAAAGDDVKGTPSVDQHKHGSQNGLTDPILQYGVLTILALHQVPEPEAWPGLYHRAPPLCHPFGGLSTAIRCKSEIRASMMFPRKFTGPFELLLPRSPYCWGATLITFCSRVSPMYRHSRSTCIVTSKQRFPGFPMCSSTWFAAFRINLSWGMWRFRGVHPFSASASKHQMVSETHNRMFRGNWVVS